MNGKDQRLPKAHIISKATEIKCIREQGERLSAGKIRVFRLPTLSRRPRLAVALTVKAGSSVARNRGRRKIREFFRQNKRILGGFDYFFYSNRDVSSLSKGDWERIFQTILRWCRKTEGRRT